MTNRRIHCAITQAVLAATFSLALFSPTYAATLTQTGTPGTNGTNATTDAGNGTNGTPGQDLTLPITSSDPSNSITITGGTGGNGGSGAPTTSAPQAGNAGAGANGGNATLTATLTPTADGTSNLTATGGAGGSAGLPGLAGTSSTAGNTSIAGNGGIANVTANATTSGNITLNFTAQGGTGGNRAPFAISGNGGNGGDALANLTFLSNGGNLTVVTKVGGGQGGSGTTAFGNGGNATNSVTATINSNNGVVNFFNSATGGSSFPFSTTAPFTPLPSIAGNATSFTSSTVNGNSSVQITDDATGGINRNGAGGNSASQAIGNSSGSGNLSVSSFSNAGAGENDGSSTSTATGIDTGTGQLFVSASASDVTVAGQNLANGAHADAFASGTSYTAQAQVSVGHAPDPSLPDKHGALAYMDLFAAASTSSQSLQHVQADGKMSAATILTKSDAAGLAAAAYLAASPSAPQTSAAISNTSNIKSLMNSSSAEDIALGTLAITSRTANTPVLNYQAITSFFIDSAVLQQPSQDLLLGLISPSFTDEGGLSSIHFTLTAGNPLIGANVIDTTFSSYANAIAYFTDNPIDLGTISSFTKDNGDVELNISLDITASTPGNAFAFDYIVANAIPTPEPASLSLLAAALPLLLKRRRQA